MSDIIVHKNNDVYLDIDTSKDIARELNEYFSFWVEGAYYMPAYKKGWDGYKRLFHLNAYQLYVGLFPRLLRFAQESGYSITTTSEDLQPSYEDGITPRFIKDYTDSLNIHSDGEPIEMRDYQLYAIWYSLKKHRTLLLSPTSSGKSAIIYAMIRYIQDYVLEDGEQILMLLPRTGLVNQMFNDFKDYSSNVEWSAEENIHKIMGGEDKESEGFFTFTLENNEKYKFYGSQYIKIINSNDNFKKAKDITYDDEIDYGWLLKQKNKQIL